MEEREYRFVGGPWHGERHRMDGRLVWYVPDVKGRDIDGGYNPAVAWREGDSLTETYTGIRCAVYELAGDYPAERFYQFTRVEQR